MNWFFGEPEPEDNRYKFTVKSPFKGGDWIQFKSKDGTRKLSCQIPEGKKIGDTFEYIDNGSRGGSPIEAAGHGDSGGEAGMEEERQKWWLRGDALSMLIKAIAENSTEQVDSALDAGATLEQPLLINGSNALHLAAFDGLHEMCKYLLKKGAAIDAPRKIDGHTALIMAAMGECPEAVGVLLENGADPNLRDKKGATALIHAAFGGNIKSVKRLLNGGANSHIKDNQNKTALVRAQSQGHDDTVAAIHHAVDLFEPGLDGDHGDSGGAESSQDEPSEPDKPDKPDKPSPYTLNKRGLRDLAIKNKISLDQKVIDDIFGPNQTKTWSSEAAAVNYMKYAQGARVGTPKGATTVVMARPLDDTDGDSDGDSDTLEGELVDEKGDKGHLLPDEEVIAINFGPGFSRSPPVASAPPAELVQTLPPRRSGPDIPDIPDVPGRAEGNVPARGTWVEVELEVLGSDLTGWKNTETGKISFNKPDSVVERHDDMYSQTEASRAAAAGLRAELQGMTIKELKKRARSLGADQDAIDDLDDEEDVKTAAIELAMKVSLVAAGDGDLERTTTDDLIRQASREMGGAVQLGSGATHRRETLYTKKDREKGGGNKKKRTKKRRTKRRTKKRRTKRRTKKRRTKKR